MFCHKCGNKLIDSAKFCAKCGTTVISEDGGAPQVQDTPDKPEAETLQTAVPAQTTQLNVTEETYRQDTSNDSEKAPKAKKVKRPSIISTILVRIGAIALPLLAVISVLLKHPIIIGIILVIAAILIIVKFRHEPKKMAFGIGGIFVAIAVVGGLSMFLTGDNSDKYIKIVKTGTFDQYPQKTIGEAFDDYLEDETWESGLTEDGIRFVNVRGGVLYFGTEAELLVQFVVDEDNEAFTYYACEIDGVPQNDFVVVALLNTIYSEDFSASDSGGENRIVIGETQFYQNEYGNMKVTLDYVEITDKITNTYLGGYEYPDEGSVFLTAAITVENIGTENASLLTSWNTLVYDGVYAYSDYSTVGDFIDMAPLTSPTTGAIIFMIPTSVAESEGSLVLNINDGAGEAVISYVIRPGAGVSDVPFGYEGDE